MQCSDGLPGILSLSNEVICEVLSYCDPVDVAHVGLVCKRLQEVTKTRTVWYNQVRGLDIDCAPWVPFSRSWESFATHELKTIVTDAVKRRTTWNTPEKMEFVKKAEIAFDASDEPDEADGRIVEPRLLPGGEKALVVRSGILALWDLASGEQLWTAESPQGYSRCSYISCDVVDAGRTLAVAAKYRTAEDNPAESLIRVFRMDLETLEAQIISDWRFPNASLYNLFVDGDYYMAYFVSPATRAIVNWRTQKGCLVDFIDEEGPLRSLIRNTKLASDHAVAILTERNDLLVFAMPLSMLDDHMSDEHDASRWRQFDYSPKDGPILRLDSPEAPQPGEGETVDIPDGRTWNLAMHVYNPSWKFPPADGAECEMFIVGYSQCRGTYNRILVSYRVHLKFPRIQELQISEAEDEDTYLPSSEVQITQVNSASALSTSIPWNSGRSVFNSGHIVLMRKPLRCFTLFSSAKQPVKELGVEGTVFDENDPSDAAAVVDPWTGTIACMTDRSLTTFVIR